MRYKWPLTGPRQGHLQPTRYKCLTFVPGGGSAWYKCEAGTFVPIGATARYKCEAICTGPCGGSAQTCNGYICFFFHLPEPPPPHSSSSLQLELPLPNGDLGSFCDDFSMILLISPRPRKLHRINGQINRTMCQGVTLHCVAVIAPISSNEDVWIAPVAHVPTCRRDGVALCSHWGPSLFPWASGLHYSHEGIPIPIQYGCTWHLSHQLLGSVSVYSTIS
jgi:hypothetical protein